MPVYESMTIRGRGGSLPRYQGRGGTYAPGAGVSARLDASAAGIAADAAKGANAAVGRLGAALSGAAQQGVKAYDDYARSKATELITRYRTSMNEAMYGENGIMNTQGEAALDAGERWAAQAADLRGSLTQDAHEQVKYYFNLMADGEDEESGFKARQHAAKQKTVMLNRNDEAASQERADSAVENYADPEGFSRRVGQSLWYAEQYLRRNGYDGESLAQGLKTVSSRIFRGGIENALACGDVDSARRLLSQGRARGGEGGYLSAQDASWAVTAIRDEQEARTARAAANADKAARDLLKNRDEAVKQAAYFGNVTLLEDIALGLEKIGRTEDARSIRSEAEQYGKTKELRAFASRCPLPELAGRMEAVKADLDAAEKRRDSAACDRHTAALETLSVVYESRIRALNQDPAAAAESGRDFSLPDDASPEDRASARLDWQKKNGLDGTACRPLTLPEVDSLAGQYAGQDSPSAFIREIRENYGSQYVPVMRQLVASGKFPKTMNLIADMAPAAGDLLAQASRPDFVRKAEGAIGMTEQDTRVLKTSIGNALEDVSRTLMACGDIDAVDLIHQAAYGLALQYRMQGMGVSEAAGRAASEVFAGRYHVFDAYRVPGCYDADAVRLGAGQAVRDMVSSDAASSAELLRNAQELSPEQARMQSRRLLERHAQWITNDDESGLMLTVNGRLVRTRDGGYVTRSFEELERLGRTVVRHREPDPEGAMSPAGGF